MVDAHYSDDYADFGRYAGGTAEGFRDGRGKYAFANPYFSYDGEWRAGQMTARARSRWRTARATRARSTTAR